MNNGCVAYAAVEGQVKVHLDDRHHSVLFVHVAYLHVEAFGHAGIPSYTSNFHSSMSHCTIAGHRQAAARLARSIQDAEVEMHKLEKKWV